MWFMDADAPVAGEAHDGIRRPAAAMRSFRGRSAWLARHVLPHEPALRAWIEGRGVDGPEADDIVNETYAVLAALDGVDHIASPRAYAFQTAHSVMLRRLRGSGIVDSAATAGPAPERPVSLHPASRCVRDLIAQLPPPRREAFSLRSVEGLSQRDIAVRMAITEGQVEEHIARALHFLMSAMKAGACVRASGPTGDGEARAA